MRLGPVGLLALRVVAASADRSSLAVAQTNGLHCVRLLLLPALLPAGQMHELPTVLDEPVVLLDVPDAVLQVGLRVHAAVPATANLMLSVAHAALLPAVPAESASWHPAAQCARAG